MSDPRIAYILNQFPCLTEAFILREMVQLERRGILIFPCALVRPGEGPVSPQADPFLPRSTYRPPPASAESALDWLRACARWPRGGSSATLLAALHSLRNRGQAKELCGSLAAACHFASAMRRHGAQHIHAHFGSMPGTVGLLLAEITGLPLSLSLHARDVFTDESILLPMKLAEAEFAVTCTQAALDRLLRSVPAALHPRLHLVRHGLDMAEFATVERRPAREPVIAIVGRLVEKKGHEILLRAVEPLRRMRARFHVVIAGDGPFREHLEGMAARMGLASRVTFCRTLSPDEVKQLLAVAHVLVAPSVVAADGDRDGLPNVILEAAAVGVPIVASNVSAIPEFVAHGETGLLVPPGDPRGLASAIESILADPAHAEALARRARRRVLADYDGYRNAEALEALFRRALAGR